MKVQWRQPVLQAEQLRLLCLETTKVWIVESTKLSALTSIDKTTLAMFQQPRTRLQVADANTSKNRSFLSGAAVTSSGGGIFSAASQATSAKSLFGGTTAQRSTHPIFGGSAQSTGDGSKLFTGSSGTISISL